MNKELSDFQYGSAICYSGYREGQSPMTETYPSYDQIKEDLLILAGEWTYLRLYDCSVHAETVIEVIQKERLDFKVMLGASIDAEINNPGCPWGGSYSDEILLENKHRNEEQIDKLIDLANQHPETVFSLSVGNEATAEWTDHLVPVDRVIGYVRKVKAGARQSVTFCENYVAWLDKLEPLVAEVDFISLHTYPIWEYKGIEEAIGYSKDNYYSVAHKYPEKPVVITEAGWATGANGKGIPSEVANEDLQISYCADLIDWTRNAKILTFVFEAFDEPWKGSTDPMEPEKHWGLYTVNRKPKKVVDQLHSTRV